MRDVLAMDILHVFFCQGQQFFGHLVLHVVRTVEQIADLYQIPDGVAGIAEVDDQRSTHFCRDGTVADQLVEFGGDAATQTVTAANAGSLADIPVGGVFTVAGSPGNDGSYTVLANDGDTITIETRQLTDETPAPATATLSAPPWYRGDTLARSHDVDDARSIDLDITAIDPAFEKAIRAMSLIAQGKFGAEGGLDQNSQRIDEAMYLLNSALNRVVSGAPPFGPEAFLKTIATLRGLSLMNYM